MKTRSEELFENFWLANGRVAQPVERAGHRTPDYAVERLGRTVIFEVKELDPNWQDQVAAAVLNQGRAFADYQKNRVRPILKHVSPQLRRACQSGKPTVLVIFNQAPFSAGTDPDSVLQGMFGRKNVAVSFSEDGSPTASEPFLAGNEGLTPEHNTSMSALSILRQHGDGSLSLDVFHNPFAKIPLVPDWCSGLPVRQVVVVEDGRFCGYGHWPELRHWGIVR